MMEPQFKVHEEVEQKGYGKFAIEPLEQGYGHTLGNSLRRVLLSSLKGAAITVVKIEGVRHQFSTITGLKEDVVELILNIKKIRLHIATDEEVKLTLVKQGPSEVYARDIEVPAGVTIANPDLYLGTLADKKGKLEVELFAKTGYGYETASEKQVSTIGYMPIDSLYTPVTRVNYKIEATRVGRMTNLDKLVLEIWTDGTLSAKDALHHASKILVSYFMQLYEPKAKAAEAVALSPSVSDEILKMRIEELDIPTRIVNALENGGIETVGQLLGTKKEDLMRVKNLGMKSISIIEERLREKGVAFSV